MSLQVVIQNATNVPNCETLGESDPYAIIEFQGIKKQTQVIHENLNPVWNESFEFILGSAPLQASDVLSIIVKDWERIGRSRVLGKADIPLKDISQSSGKTTQLNVTLNDANYRPLTSKLNLKLSYTSPTGRVDQTVAGNDIVDGELGQSEDGTRVEVAGGIRGGRSARPTQVTDVLPAKPTDFQIRVRVVEARQLQGPNIHPVTRIGVANQKRQTRVKRSTNSPFWNEVFFFNFHLTPTELFEEVIEFQVFNSRKLRSDALIGSFKCDIGMVYHELQHSLINKWLLLSDPEDTMAGVKGYLKVCVIVLGPGDEAPSIKIDSEDSDDIEANLLRPAGVQLRPATFLLKLYRAEDIPRMDTAFMEGIKKLLSINEEQQKELVDPYLIFSFAGKQVRSKIMYANDHPEWNQELRLGLRFPSMCERIKLTVKDWDRISDDDTVSTAIVNINTLSTNGDFGYLPTFGPSYINFYGSTREYSDLPDEFDDLNEGKGEGVAYRGRVLLELITQIGEMPDEPVADIVSDDIFRVQKYMRRRKYRLHAAVLNATMISVIESPVEFEISIGNYGNKLEENIAPCASTTQPTNAVFDGCHYYFLPWGNSKPCVAFDCHWEDISFRLEALNLLLKIIDNVEANVEKIKIAIQANLSVEEIVEIQKAALKQLLKECSTQLPKPQANLHNPNDLDRLFREHRLNELSDISRQTQNLLDQLPEIEATVTEIESLITQLYGITHEPQNSMPDVVIWMITGQKRVAYYRIPAYELLYSENLNFRGRQCGIVQTIALKYPGKIEKKTNIPALVRIKLWLGLQNQEAEWHQMQTEGELAVFAETFENQVNILGSWTNRGPTMSRPKFSDSQGKINLAKDLFEPPTGWSWEADWYVSPEMSMLYDKDSGHQNFVDDVYECQSRVPLRDWGHSSRPYTDVKGDPVASREETELPEGWQWDDVWQCDMNRAVDEEGWEYCVEATMGGFGPVERTYHLCRRRRWLRSRTLVKEVAREEDEVAVPAVPQDGWEYAPLFNMKFHLQERTVDLVRRRRWHRKMVARNSSSNCFFTVKRNDGDTPTILSAPRMFLTFNKPYKYHMRAYMYQARDLLAADQSGLSDPFVRVSFMNHSHVTERIERTLCPTWDQTLIFNEILIHGSPENICNDPPDVIIEIFDYDIFGEPEFMGRTRARPLTKADMSDKRAPVLQWFHVWKNNKPAGEMLAAFEMYLMTNHELPFLPPKRGKLFMVPTGIRPILQRTAVEVLCWGVRNMKTFQLAEVTSPSIKFECSGYVVESGTIKNTKKNPNFDEPLLFFDVMLPEEELYMPPLNISVIDHRQFGRKPAVGVSVIKSLEKYRCEPQMAVLPLTEGDTSGVTQQLESLLDSSISQLCKANAVTSTELTDPLMDSVIEVDDPEMEQKRRKKKKKIKGFFKKVSGSDEEGNNGVDLLAEDIDWWSKYYASIGERSKCKNYLEEGYDTLQVYTKELEKVGEYNGFSDFCLVYDLSRGKDIVEEEEVTSAGEFKGTFRVYKLPDNPQDPLPAKILNQLPSSSPEPCLIRVYVIKALDLQPNDSSGLADPYVQIVVGNKKMDNRDNYVPNSVTPVFGHMFELNTVIPIHKDLIVRVKDYDLLTSDDVIGETVIDLENRYLSKFRATVGLPATFCSTGPNQWCHSQSPMDILKDYCIKNNLTLPKSLGNASMTFKKKVYKLSSYEKKRVKHPFLGPAEERLALYILRSLPMVQEHIETRPLYSELQPGIEQGKLQLFVHIFPMSLGPPGKPIDISQRRPKGYELRVIIWNTKDVILEEESITGEKMSDIYVKGWMSACEERYSTDVHYRSLDGEGNFNWRFVFAFEYLPAEQSMVIKKKEHFWSLDDTEHRLAPTLMIQVWDNDKFSADDFLGTLELNLNQLFVPTKSSSACSLNQLSDIGQTDGKKATTVKTVNLFDQKRLRGFWPCYNDESGKPVLTGKVEMELELVTAEDAEARPAGQGRDEPNMNPTLDPPIRPETSFLWFASPFKTLKMIVWRRYKWYCIALFFILLLIFLIGVFIYTFPSAVANKIVGT